MTYDSGAVCARAASTVVCVATTAVVCALLALGCSRAEAARLAPLPRSDYTLRPACAAPEPGRVGCLALGMEPRTAAARARVHPLATAGSPRTGLAKASECTADYPSACLTPQDLRSAYFPGEQPEAPASEPQTIALVDAYNDYAAEANLNAYSTEFGLPACTTANGCFEQVNEHGGEGAANLPFPKTKAELETFSKGSSSQREEAEEAEGWSLEIATDIEVAHAVCQNCRILLVEGASAGYTQLETAENEAVQLNATEVSNSWGGEEPPSDSSAFDHHGVAITAATGDYGYLNWEWYATRNEAGSPYFEGSDYPASSPHVIAVGGTRLNLTAGRTWQSESAWSSGGGGCSALLEAPEWQRAVSTWTQVGCGERRANADVSADADPSTGVDVYDTVPYPYEENGKKLTTVLRWIPIGGTSVASPIIASMIALAGGAHGVSYPAQTLYSHIGSALLHDVAGGGNGECTAEYTSCGGSLSPLSPLDCGAGALICNAASGYDGPTGVGTPHGIGAFQIGEPAPEGSEEPGKPVEEAGKPEEGGSEGVEPPGGDSKGGEPPSGGSEGGGPKSESPSGGSKGGELPSGGASTGAGDSGSLAASGTGSSSVAPGVTATQSRAPTHSNAGNSATLTPRLSALRLTVAAKAALQGRGRLTVAQVAFSFILSRAASVRVALAVRVRSGLHAHWRALAGSLRLAAIRGINRRRLHGSAELPPGAYLLTLTPASGRARSIVIRVG